MSKQSQTHFNQMTMFAFSDSVLLGSMGTGHTVRYTGALKVMMDPMILAAPIGLDGFNFSV
jgi:hypothetical protein